MKTKKKDRNLSVRMTRKAHVKLVISLLLALAFLLQPIGQVVSYAEGNEEKEEIVIDKKISLKPNPVPVSLSDVGAWDPSYYDYDYINKSSVDLHDRVKGAPINEYASEDAKIMPLIYFSGSNSRTVSSVGDNTFDTNAFDQWTYVDHMVYWDGPVPTPDVIDSAHKNGVPILGTLFFNWSSSSVDNGVFANFMKKDENGSYISAKKLAEIAVHYGFDGYFFNQETTGSATYGKSQELRDLMLEMKKHARELGKELIISWYDAMNNNGYRSHEDSVTPSNDIWMKKVDGKIPADNFFMNFNWGSSKVSSTINHMDGIGRNPFNAFAGLELQKDISYRYVDRQGLLGDDNKLRISLGLFVPDTINGDAETPEMLHDVVNKFWTGENRNPANINDNNKFNGMARYVVDSTPILNPDFYTSFNTGHGRYWFRDGIKVSDEDWNARSVQDILPTWTWWMKSDKDVCFNTYYDFEDAYNGGSSIMVYGDMEAWSIQELMLYSTKFQAAANTKINLVTKGGMGSSIKLNVYTDEDYQVKKDVAALSGYSSEEWTETVFDLSSFAGQTIYAISLSFENTDALTDYKFNLGQLTINNGENKLAQAKNLSILEKAVKTGTTAEAIIEFDRVDGAYRYDVYSVEEDGTEKWVNSSSSNMIYIANLTRSIESASNKQTIRVYAVSKTGSLSAAAETEFDWEFAATEVTKPKDKYRNITPEAKMLSTDEPTKAKLINDTLIDLTDKWQSGQSRDEAVIEFDEPRTVKRWRIEHAGHAGESVNDGLMNTKDFNLEYMDEDGQWHIAEAVRGNILHVTDHILEKPITAKRWKLNVITRDNGTRWGYIRIYNWKMYEEIDTQTENIPMTAAQVKHQAENKFTLLFKKEQAPAFYQQYDMSKFTLRIYRDKDEKDLIDQQTLNEDGFAIFKDVELEGNSGVVYYTLQEEGKEASNRLVVLYESDYEGEVTEIPTIENPLVENAKIVSIDAGRRYYTESEIKEIIDIISDLGYDYLHLLLGNDGLRLVLDDMTVKTTNTSYESEAVKEAIKNGNEEYSTRKNVVENKDSALSQAEMDSIFEYAKEKNIEIIPAINMPGHMDAILTAMETLGIYRPHYYNGNVKSVTTLDINKDEVVEFAEEFAQLYINYFKTKGVKVYNFGADEYANDAFGNPGWSNLINLGIYDKFVTFANNLSERALRAGMRPMAFNDGFYYNGQNANVNDQLIIAYWTAGWWGFNVASTERFEAEGHEILNVNDSWYYVVGNEDSGIYNRQNAINKMGQDKYKFESNVGKKVRTIGSMICLWNDNPSKPYEVEKFRQWAEKFATENKEYFKGEESPQEVSEPFVNPIVNADMIFTKPSEWWVYNFAQGNKKENMIDKDDSTFTWWATPNGRNGYIEGDAFGLDLGEEYKLGRFRMAMGSQAPDDLDHIYKYRIRYSSDGINWETYGQDISQDDNFKVTDFVFEDVKARYVIVEAADSAKYWIKISDFMVETFDIVNKDLLIQTLEEANQLDREGKTQESIEKLDEAIKSATQVLADDQALQETVDLEVEKLMEAMNSLADIPVEVSADALIDLIARIKEINTENNTEESVGFLQEAVDAAQAVIENAERTEEDIDVAISTLIDALVGLEEIEELDLVKTTLEKIIEKAKSIDLENINEEYSTKFNEAVVEAQNLLEKEDLTQEEIDDQVLKLVELIIGLSDNRTDIHEEKTYPLLLEGLLTSMNKDQVEEVVIKTKAEANTLEKIKVDGLDIDQANYEVEGESTISISKEFIESLTEGNHVVELHFVETDSQMPAVLNVIIEIKVSGEETENPETPEKPEEPETIKEKLVFVFGNGKGMEIEAEVGDTIIIPEGPEKEGYRFLYWKGSIYYPGDKYVVEEGGHEFEAIYEKINDENEEIEEPSQPEETDKPEE
ncbi:MAG: family 20 glycosylhydrolase, partial [Tissierellia bacterium]|nr:family 20 glycosylhydrolase [Tissierellia bacterium]